MSTTSSLQQETVNEPPSDAIKDRLIDDFKEFTGIGANDEISEENKRGIAIDFLAQVAWDIQKAVENYLVVYGSE